MPTTNEEQIAQLTKTFTKKYGYDPAFAAQAPGRINLVGDNSDYNRGLVLLAAIDRHVRVVARPKTGLKEKICSIYSEDYSASDSFSLGTVEYSDSDNWKNYFRGLISVWQKAGFPLVAFEAAFSGNIPQGAGLSSSGAYLVACAKLLNEMMDTRLSNLHIALLAQQAESEFVGVKCGLMDQLLSCLAMPDSALLIDMHTFASRAVPLALTTQEYSFLITDCGVPCNSATSKYNERRTQCEQAVNLLASYTKPNTIFSLRDVNDLDLSTFDDNFPLTLHKRSRHVLEENARVEDAARLLEQGDLPGFGSLMNESHASLCDLYEVTSSELDLLVSLAQKLEGVLGSRMTSAGFAGSTVTLLKADRIEAFKYHVIRPYEIATGLKTEVFLFNFAGGATAAALSSSAGLPAATQVFQPTP